MVFQTSTSSTPNAHQAPGRQSRSSTHPNPPDPPWETFPCLPLTSWPTRQSTSLDPACAFVRSPSLQLPLLTCLHRDALAPFPSLPDVVRRPPRINRKHIASEGRAVGTPERSPQCLWHFYPIHPLRSCPLKNLPHAVAPQPKNRLQSLVSANSPRDRTRSTSAT